MLNVCYRGCRQLFPGTKILKNDLLTAEKINFKVGSKKNMFEKFLGRKKSDFFNGKSMKIDFHIFSDFRFSLIFH